ncbi:MAG: TIR domain-containing protein, partial [Pseudomonadota bacterium]
MERSKVFISYSHKNHRVAERIYSQLSGYGVAEDQIFWDRSEVAGIEPGDDWDERIRAELDRTRVALFIVSQESRQSEYIEGQELKPILDAKRRGQKISIFWIRAVHVDPPPGLQTYQGLCNGEILTDIHSNKGQHQIDDIAKAILSELDLGPNAFEQFYNHIARIARREYGMLLDRQIAIGENSIVYRASAGGRRSAIKARVARDFELSKTPSDEVLKKKLGELEEITHPAFIEFQGGTIRGETQILVSEYLPRARPLGRKLADLREHGGQLSVDRVRIAVSSLAGALAAFHEKGIAYGNLRPSDVLFIHSSEDDWHVKIPKFRMTKMDQLDGVPERCLPFHPEIISYLAPEQHRELRITPKSDQYSLAILAIEMLQGQPPVRVETLDDIKRKENFFANPEAFSEGWRHRSPRLRKVLLKMLALNPRNRYRSMQKIVEELRIEKNTREDCRRIAKSSYNSFARGKMKLLEGFYDRLFTKHPRLKRHFDDLGDQKALLKKLDRAILYLLNFRREDMAHEPTILTATRQRHERLDLSATDFDDFAQCFLDMLHAAGEVSEETQQAWRVTLQPGVDYMKALHSVHEVPS